MPRTPIQPQGSAPRPPIQVIDPRWLLKAGALVILGAALCAYATLCLLFWQGQWQLVLSPSASVTATPASASLPFEAIQFGVDATGTPQLTGWWIPSESPSDPTALVLHGANGNMADALHSAQSMHAARLNVFVFDYRGFGQSAGPHPTQASMQHDAHSALEYLTGTRHIPVSRIVLFGEGAGASLAVQLAAEHKDVPALVLMFPAGDFQNTVAHDARARLVPLWLLFHERFPVAAPLATLTTPKLILEQEGDSLVLPAAGIADPKMTVTLHTESDRAAEPLRSLRRFLDEYVPH